MTFLCYSFTVSQNTEVEFRLVGVSGDYIMQLSIDDHSMQVVSSDGHTVLPVSVDTIIFAPGERFDVRVHTNQPNPGNYWIRVRVLRAGKGPNLEQDGKEKNVASCSCDLV